jgi:hypothetical protein
MVEERARSGVPAEVAYFRKVRLELIRPSRARLLDPEIIILLRVDGLESDRISNCSSAFSSRNFFGVRWPPDPTCTGAGSGPGI